MTLPLSDFINTVREWLCLYSEASSSSSLVEEAVNYTRTLSESSAFDFIQRLESVDDQILPSLTLSKAFWRSEAVLACSHTLAMRSEVSEKVFLDCLDRILTIQKRLPLNTPVDPVDSKDDLLLQEKIVERINKEVYPWSWMIAEKLWKHFPSPFPLAVRSQVAQWLKDHPLLPDSIKQSEMVPHESQEFDHDPENVHRTSLVLQLRRNLIALRNEYYTGLGSPLHRQALMLEWRIEDDDILRCVYTDTTIFYLDPEKTAFPLMLSDAWKFILVAVHASSIDPVHFVDRLQEECYDNFAEVCFMGRLSRLVNSLSGLHPHIQLRIDLQDAMRYRWRRFLQEYTQRLPEETCEMIFLGMISSSNTAITKERKAWIQVLRYLIPEFLWILRTEEHGSNTEEDTEMLWRILRQEDPTLDRLDFDLL